MESRCDIIFKIIAIGDSGTGKTCFLKQYVGEMFSSSYKSTIGVDFMTKAICYRNRRFKLQLWDTAGQDRFSTLVKSFYRGAHAIILCCSVDNPCSIDNIHTWMDEVREHSLDDDEQIFIMVLNKCDIPHEKHISGKAYRTAVDNNLPLFETSAKNNDNIESAFTYLLDKLLDDHKMRTEAVQMNPILPALIDAKKKKCCY